MKPRPLKGGGVQNGPKPRQLVVVSAVRNAVSAATMTFTTVSMILCVFMVFVKVNGYGFLRSVGAQAAKPESRLRF